MKEQIEQLSLFDFEVKKSIGTPIATGHTFPCSACDKDGEQCSEEYATSGKFCEEYTPHEEFRFLKPNIRKVAHHCLFKYVINTYALRAKLDNMMIGNVLNKESCKKELLHSECFGAGGLHEEVEGQEFNGYQINSKGLEMKVNNERYSFNWSEIYNLVSEMCMLGMFNTAKQIQLNDGIPFYCVTPYGTIEKINNVSYAHDKMQKYYSLIVERGLAQRWNTFSKEQINEYSELAKEIEKEL